MRFLRFSIPLLGLFGVVSALHADNNSTDPPQYTVKRTTTVPAIDGVISPGEWDSAAAAAGDYVDLRTHVPDNQNSRFRMMWDDTALYILGETDFTGFVNQSTWAPFGMPANPNFSGLTYSPRLYFDSNADGEDLNAIDPSTPDGYLITWSQDLGKSIRRPTPEKPETPLRDPLDENGNPINDYVMGLFLEAHVNDKFGNLGNWNVSNDGPNQNYRDDYHPGLLIGLSADNENLNGTGQGGGVWEVAIAWSAFDATNPEDADYTGPENGLYHVNPPVTGEIWGFESSVITPDSGNFLPSWSEPQGGNQERGGFEHWPHGRIVFDGSVSPLDCNGDGAITAADLQCACASGTKDQLLAELGLLPGDFDGNKSVAFADFLVLSANFGTAVTEYTKGDIDCDGRVAFSDFLTLSANFGKPAPAAAAAAAVPEPSVAVLGGLGLFGLLSRRSRRK